MIHLKPGTLHRGLRIFISCVLPVACRFVFDVFWLGLTTDSLGPDNSGKCPPRQPLQPPDKTMLKSLKSKGSPWLDDPHGLA